MLKQSFSISKTKFPPSVFHGHVTNTSSSLYLVKIVVVKPDGPPKLCKTDEVGELCVASGTVGSAYFGLVGKTNHSFKVQPLGADGGPVEQYSHYSEYVRTGLLGFLGPVSYNSEKS